MNTNINQQQAEITRQIEDARKKIHDLEEQLRLVDIEIEELFSDRNQYLLLSEISDRLDKLNKLGGACLFWGDDCDEKKSVEHFNHVNNLVINYDESVKVVQTKRENLKNDIQSIIAQVYLLNEEIVVLHEHAEESENEFVIEREMTVHPFRPMMMPWTKQGEDEKRFRKFVLISLLLSLLLGYFIPLWDLPLPERSKDAEITERLAKLIVKKEPPPPPPPKVEQLQKEEEKKLADKPKPKEEKVKQARKKAESAGLLAFKDNFADLMENEAEKKLGAQARIQNKGQKATKITRSLVTSGVTGTTGGINTASLSRNVGGAGKGLEGVEFSRVESAIGSEFFGEERPLSDGPGPSRTDEEIQIVFDRYKAALYRIYNRELRKNPTLQGKLVLRLTIEPDGSVSKCSMESSDMNAVELEAKIVDRVKKFNFGPKDNVPAVTILYPIDFLPAT